MIYRCWDENNFFLFFQNKLLIIYCREHVCCDPKKKKGQLYPHRMLVIQNFYTVHYTEYCFNVTKTISGRQWSTSAWVALQYQNLEMGFIIFCFLRTWQWYDLKGFLSGIIAAWLSFLVAWLLWVLLVMKSLLGN